ncbi:hypothetical protein MCOR27_003049 [Pyricularia oryzae]|uniref:Glutaminase GtaA n=1 Tax=Pyricularia grisea TaxID=148305 RepID=A0ABQ8NP00_PYRGI|nr:hypothetical protein MCOR01_009043 [Pyricularia oryzae]KAI6300002.1 hypothetical protein MCOR33_004208 [Pyricularia grisea]KAH9439729.1 hypothetical protein MCOR02_003268 [Pyricularia oryzae]KAI6259602.1 hypothetical protein MCOR19_004051 [Pyricularia oryzae]KAI6278590.1 hypothetical protein MCOR26_004574 [Pyricularia oryzae]
MGWSILLFVAAAYGLCAREEPESTFSPVRPPSIPLAVRSPYLNTWLDGESKGILPGNWPKFWTGENLGWQGYVRVDGTNFNWMGGGEGAEHVKQLSYEYTATRSIFQFNVGDVVNMTVTFLSPIYPQNLVKQSLQFSYVNIRMQPSDGRSHSIQLYMDITGEFAGGNRLSNLTWNYSTSGGIAYHQVSLANQVTFQESNEQANWGNWYLATSNGQWLTHKNGHSYNETRQQFLEDGRLNNTKDTNYRAVNESWPVFAFSKDFQIVQSYDIVETVYTLGLSQNQVINFQGATNGPAALEGLWRSRWLSGVDSMISFHNDYRSTYSETQVLDEKIRADSAAAAGDNYAAITTLSVRQTFASLQFAQRRFTRQRYIFMKEISSNSDIQTVDVIFPTYPILMYLNPTLGKLLLDPLFENQESGHYPNRWAIHDLGTFPNAIGHPRGDDEKMPLEECGNMIIMALAYAQRSGDDAYLRRHWNKLQQWAEFLVADSLVPANQLSTDDFAGALANQTNLALKGVIGLRAMVEVADRAAVNASAGPRYGRIARDYLSRWQTLGVNRDASPPHATLTYNDPDSHGLLYNLYADKMLGLGFVNQSVYDMQSEFYRTVELEYGVPLDTRHTWAKTDWQIFAAAVASKDTRDMFISKIRNFIEQTTTTRPFTDLYDASTGGFPADGPTFVARPVQGGTFALLALRQ